MGSGAKVQEPRCGARVGGTGCGGRGCTWVATAPVLAHHASRVIGISRSLELVLMREGVADAALLFRRKYWSDRCFHRHYESFIKRNGMKSVTWWVYTVPTLIDERRKTTRAALRSTAALLEKVGEQGVRYCVAFGIRGSHMFRPFGVRSDEFRRCSVFGYHSRHMGRRGFSNHSGMANVPHFGSRNRCDMGNTEETEDGIQTTCCTSSASTNAIRGIQ